jgi:hypothetical protein
MDRCSECGAGDELRPYGKDGAPICFDCAMKPLNLPRTRAAVKAALESARTVPVITDQGIVDYEDLCPMAKA